MSASKGKGSAWERKIVEALRESGATHAERRLAGSSRDRGDIAGLPGVVIEAKNGARVELAAWVDEAELERANDGASLGVVWHHRKGRGSAVDGYVTMTGATFIRLLREAGHIPENGGHNG